MSIIPIIVFNSVVAIILIITIMLIISINYLIILIFFLFQVGWLPSIPGSCMNWITGSPSCMCYPSRASWEGFRSSQRVALGLVLCNFSTASGMHPKRGLHWQLAWRRRWLSGGCLLRGRRASCQAALYACCKAGNWNKGPETKLSCDRGDRTAWLCRQWSCREAWTGPVKQHSWPTQDSVSISPLLPIFASFYIHHYPFQSHSCILLRHH